MQTKHLVAAMGFLSFLFGSCSKQGSKQLTATPLPEITFESQVDGFVDLTFAICSHTTLADGSQTLNAYAVHRGQQVGVIVVLGSEWKRGSLDSEVPLITYQGVVSYQSLGAPSDALIKILDELYGTKIAPRAFGAEIVFAGVSLEGEPASLAKGPSMIKLFYESDDEDRYAELFTNIDLANGVLQIREKDPEYRSAVIRALKSN